MTLKKLLKHTTKNRSKEFSLDHAAIKEAVETCVSRPAYVEFDKNKMCGKMLRLPDRSELNAEINETLIVEYYNR